jgi:hypothetical protein
LKLAHFPVKIGLFGGEEGVPEIVCLIGILIFFLLRSPCKKLKPYDNPFWGFEQRYEEKRRKRLITKNSGLPKLLCWSHALRSDQNLIMVGEKCSVNDSAFYIFHMGWVTHEQCPRNRLWNNLGHLGPVLGRCDNIPFIFFFYIIFNVFLGNQ